MSFRPIVGLYRRFYDNQPLPNAPIKIKLSVNDFDLEAGYPVEEMTFTTSKTGELPAGFSLWTNADGYAGSLYVVTEPDGFKWQFVLPPGNTEISLQALRAGGQPVTPPDTIISLIDNRAVRFDGAQTLTNTQKAQARANIGAGTGSGSGGGAEFLDELDDVLITSPGEGHFLQFLSGLWVNRTIAQVKASLSFLTTVLDGISFFTDSAVTAADSILTAFGKLQAQITTLFATKAEKRVEYLVITTSSFNLSGEHLGKIVICTNAADITAQIGDGLGGGFNCAVRKASAGTNKILFNNSGDTSFVFPTGHSKSDSFKNATVTIETPDGQEFNFSGATAA